MGIHYPLETSREVEKMEGEMVIEGVEILGGARDLNGVQYSLEPSRVADIPQTPTVVEMIGMGTSHCKGGGGFQQ